MPLVVPTGLASSGKSPLKDGGTDPGEATGGNEGRPSYPVDAPGRPACVPLATSAEAAPELAGAALGTTLGE